MSTHEVANKWAEYCRTGQGNKAQDELYADNCVSIEMDGAQGFPPRVEGLAAIKEKGKQWEAMVEEFHKLEVDGPIVAGDHFSATMRMDIKMKGQPRKMDEEICLFKVANGKIVSEQFFYEV